ncbi:glycosyltransferase family 39 protein [Candidatus Roizmanbacteria bacterium]|nr:glycosyltransferase family 39 protein [Candidatus Roizmanbacteria bacterium]
MKKYLILATIFCLAVFLRFYHLDLNPPSLSWDEASIGYNAYSITQTLKDEHGRFLPYDYFAAFGDYKPPVSIYLTALSIKLFGFSTWAIRFPSAFLGVLTVLLTFFLAEELRKHFNSKTLTFGFSLLASFILAISPWHTLLSRAEFESNLATFFIVLGTLCFLKAFRHGIFFLAAALFLVIPFYTFNSARLFVPLFLLGLFLLFFKEIIKQKKYAVLSLVLAVVMLLPLLPHLLSPLGRLRFQEVNIFSDANVVTKANARNDVDANAGWAKLIHNRRIGYGLLFLSHYFDHFNIDYLFFNGDVNPKFSDRTNGEFFLIEAIFLVAGALFLLKKERRLVLFILLWLLLGLVPSATARETPHALRTEVSLPTWQILSAAGLYYLYALFLGKWKKIFIIIITGLLTWEFFMYLHNYYVHYPLDYSQDWEYGYKLAAEKIISYKDKYDTIWVTEKYGRPYIFLLTYQKYSPEEFQTKAKVTIDAFGFYHIEKFDKYVFGPFVRENLRGKVLLIGAPDEMPTGVKKIEDLNFLNGEKALEIAEM